MDTSVLTPRDVFLQPQHLKVPLFQRRYVWDEEDQWLPLWQDVRRIAELYMASGAAPRHFLGAVVLQAGDHVAGNLPAKGIIDGQQRITTLQLLADATAAVFEQNELDNLSSQLGDLTHNDAKYTDGGVPTLKLQHSNKDGNAFADVMEAEPPVSYAALKRSGSRIVRAHRLFTDQVTEWLETEEDEVRERAEALTYAIAQGIDFVVIDLKPDENSQEIFETLNARGTPLTAADLIKNFVFQKLESEGADTERAYAEDWPFETAFWEQEVSVGRYLMSRSSLFFSHWLTSRIGEEISPRQTFVRFKTYVEYESNSSMSALLQHVKSIADLYQSWSGAVAETSRELTAPELTFYRMDASGVQLLKPVLLWLYEPDLELPTSIADEVAAMLESWVVRRQLLRLTLSDLGRVVADIIRVGRATSPQDLAAYVRSHLTSLRVESTYWPGDDEIRRHMEASQAYRQYPRGRLRMFLEAIENHLRAACDYPQVHRAGYPIEHVLPQRWQQHWPVSGLEAEIARSEHVHRLGNLTLLTSKLNGSVSNGPWEGEKGKRNKLRQYDVLLLNRAFDDQDTWDEAAIDDRTARLTEILLQVWPVPPGHSGEIQALKPAEEPWVEIKHLVAAGLLPVGTALRSQSKDQGGQHGVITADGMIDIGGKRFGSPSGAGMFVRGGKSTNGWSFWRLDDGRKLSDVRAQYLGTNARDRSSFDWSALHRILAALPDGQWTTYGDLADAIGTAAQPTGAHITACSQCENAERVLTSSGRLAPEFTWTDPKDSRDPIQLLKQQGILDDGGSADPRRRIRADELVGLLDPS